MYLVVDVDTSIIYIQRETARGAKITLAAMRKKPRYAGKNLDVVSLDHYNANMRKTKKVRNLISGKEIEIDINTPACADPSTETYWCM